MIDYDKNKNNIYFFCSAIPTASLLMALYSIIIINKSILKIMINKNILIDKNVDKIFI